MAACTSPTAKQKPMEKQKVVDTVQGIKLLPSDNHAIHGHGGKGALIETMSLDFEITDDKSHVIAVKNVDLVWRGCNSGSSDWYSRKSKKIARHELLGAKQASNEASVTIPAGEREARVKIVFVEAFEVYNGCEIYAYDVDVELDGVRSKQ